MERASRATCRDERSINWFSNLPGIKTGRKRSGASSSREITVESLMTMTSSLASCVGPAWQWVRGKKMSWGAGRLLDLSRAGACWAGPTGVRLAQAALAFLYIFLNRTFSFLKIAIAFSIQNQNSFK